MSARPSSRSGPLQAMTLAPSRPWPIPLTAQPLGIGHGTHAGTSDSVAYERSRWTDGSRRSDMVRTLPRDGARVKSTRRSDLRRHRTSGLLAAARFEVVLLGHHHLTAEDAHDRAVLVVTLRLHVHDAPVVLGLALPLVEYVRLAVDRVAVERRRDVLQRLDLEIRDRLAGDVGHAHAEQQRVDVVADDDVLGELGRLPRVVGIQVWRVVVHRDQAEQMVVVLGDRLARPVLVGRPDLELLIAAPELHCSAPFSMALSSSPMAAGGGRTRERAHASC